MFPIEGRLGDIQGCQVLKKSPRAHPEFLRKPPDDLAVSEDLPRKGVDDLAGYLAGYGETSALLLLSEMNVSIAGRDISKWFAPAS